MHRTHLPPVESVSVPAAVWGHILSHGQAHCPLETCGLLVGNRHGQATRWLPVTNASITTGAFLTDGAALLGALKSTRANGEYVCAVVHTHPSAPPEPGWRDIAGHTWVQVPMLIVSLRPHHPQWAAWRVRGGCARLIDRAYFKIRGHTTTSNSMAPIPAGAL